MRSLAHHGITPTGDVHWDLTTPELYEHTVRRGEGELAHHGALVVDTVPYTGRSPKDKFVVREAATEDDSDSEVFMLNKPKAEPEAAPTPTPDPTEDESLDDLVIGEATWSTDPVPQTVPADDDPPRGDEGSNANIFMLNKPK